MLCISPSSVCDVCLEAFDEDVRAPCSIECGHVFCNECLRSLQRPNCPLCRCRIPLESDSEPPFTRLRVDIGRKDPEFADADDYAQTLMTSISNVANNGSSEQQLTELIHDCKKFLHAQPREKFKELRVCHRMIKYIFDYKMESRGKQHELRAQIAAATEKQERLTERIYSYKESMRSLEGALVEEKQQRASALRSVEMLSGALNHLNLAPHLTDKAQHPARDSSLSPSPGYAMSPLPELSSLTSLPDFSGDPDRGLLDPDLPPDTDTRYWVDHYDEASDEAKRLVREMYGPPDSPLSTPATPPPSLPSSYRAEAMHYRNESKPAASPSRSRHEAYLQESATRPRSNSRVVESPEYQRDESESPPPRSAPYQPTRTPISHASIAAQRHSSMKEKRRSAEGVTDESRRQDSANSSSSRLLPVNFAPTPTSLPQKRASLTRNHSYSHGVLHPSAPIPLDQGSSSRHGVSMPEPSKGRGHRSSTSPKLEEPW